MDAQQDGGAAFPFPSFTDDPGNPGRTEWGNQGMTLRDYFAGQALVGELASTAGVESTEAMAKACVDAGRTAEQHLAFTCYKIANAMLKAREVKP